MIHHRNSVADVNGHSFTLSPKFIQSPINPLSKAFERSDSELKKRRKRVSVAFQTPSTIPTHVLFLSVVGGMVLAGCTVAVLYRVLGFVGGIVSHSSFDLKDGNERPLEHPDLPWNPIYRIPDSMATVGDRSNDYVSLRHEVDMAMPENTGRFLQRVEELTTKSFLPMAMEARNSDQVADTAFYDIYNCPDTPPPGYPYQWNLLKILDNWPADDVTPRSHIYQGFCVFDYETDYEKAKTYRDLELPFVVVNDPQVARTVERWNSPGYMERMLGNVKHRCEYSNTNHFMYYIPPPRKSARGRDRSLRKRLQVPDGWTPPTKPMRMTYSEWLNKANLTDDNLLRPDRGHWYFRLIGCGYMGSDGSCDAGSSEYLFDELPFFQPKESLYVVEPEEQKGIHCRFGMKGVIAENHFDASRNAIALLGGSRRYILAHPNQCENLALYPLGHPSARHSAVDWSNPNLGEFPQFANAMANEVVMQPGQVMYLPINWFHHIISLELNFQCNTRSGVTDHYPLDWCGF